MMSEPLELKEQTPYAIDRLDTLKAAIMHSIQEMVIHRAKVENTVRVTCRQPAAPMKRWSISESSLQSS